MQKHIKSIKSFFTEESASRKSSPLSHFRSSASSVQEEVDEGGGDRLVPESSNTSNPRAKSSTESSVKATFICSFSPICCCP